jgi:hypothetical protein
LPASVSRAGLFTVWTGTTPLLVFKAATFREAREVAKADEFLRMLRRATIIGKPLLSFTARVWVAPASEEEGTIFERAAMTANPFGSITEIVYLQQVDSQ